MMSTDEGDLNRVKALQFDSYGDAKDDVPIKRDRWSSKVDFILACVGFSIGFGNVWRFPYLVYKNGGGAFFIPFFIAVLLGGIPVFFLEVILGQFMASAGVRVWNVVPLLQGIGVGCAVILFFLNCYYNVLLTWSFYFLFSSFTTVLPWMDCTNDWNTINCFEALPKFNFTGDSKENPITYCLNSTVPDYVNTTVCVDKDNSTMLTDPVVEYWENKVLGLSSGIDQPGNIKWDLFGCLVFAWAVVYICICQGIRTSGKVMYVTATAPYLFMITLLIKGLTLEGAIEGVRYYLTPNFTRLNDPVVWVDAGTQVFFSYSISLGTLAALGSYNPWHHNSFRDSVIFSVIDSGTCILAGFVVFPILGHMAHMRGLDISDVAESGPGLAFIAYPKAVSLLPAAPVWSVLFFVMLILLGLDSQFVGVEGFVAAITDYFPRLHDRPWRRALFILAVVALKCLVGISMVCEGGMYVFQIFDYYTGSRIILVIALFECLAIGWIYGADRFYGNMNMMFGYYPNSWLKYMWKYISPTFVFIIFVLNAYAYSELEYKQRPGKIYHFPSWAIGIGWLLASLSVLAIPVVAIYHLYRTPGTLFERTRYLLKPRLQKHQVLSTDGPGDYVLVDPTGDYLIGGGSDGGAVKLADHTRA